MKKIYFIILIIQFLKVGIKSSKISKKDIQLMGYKNLLNNLLTGKTSLKKLKKSISKKRKLIINPLSPLGLGESNNTGHAIAGWTTLGLGAVAGGYGLYKAWQKIQKRIKFLNELKSEKERVLLSLKNNTTNKIDDLNDSINDLKGQTYRMFSTLELNLKKLTEVENDEHDIELNHEIEERNENEKIEHIKEEFDRKLKKKFI